MKSKIFFLLSLSLLLNDSLWAQAASNFVRTFSARDTIIVDLVMTTGTFKQVATTTAYYDGIGRPVQTVAKNASVGTLDVVQHNLYDHFGRPWREMLAYPIWAGATAGAYRPSGPGEQRAYYHNLANHGDSIAYAEKAYENAPTNRILKTAAPGTPWKMGTGKEIKFSEGPSGDSVRVFTVNASGYAVTSSYYGASQLWQSTTDDEDNNRIVEYKDKKGRLILKKVQNTASSSFLGHDGWLCTYYVYDDFDRLRVVIPPRGVEILRSKGWVSSTHIQLNKELFYRYTYDGKGRMVEKHLPGKDPEFMLYDNQNRLVGHQDGELRKTNKWLYTKYDALGRPFLTGIATVTGTRSAIQGTITGNNNSVLSGTSSPVATGGWPSTAGEIQTVTYYDNYSLLTGFSYIPPSSPYTGYHPQGINTQGLVTGKRVRNPISGSYLVSVFFYDKHGRQIQTIEENHLGANTRTSTKYDFENKPIQTVSTYSSTAAPTIVRNFYYYLSGHLKSTGHIVGSNPEVILAENIYNELGELKQKNLPIGVQEFKYNIRGWLTKINSPTAQLFRQDLFYQSGATFNKWNGNISRIDWWGRMNVQSTYDYQYDKPNRLIAATYTVPTSTTQNNRYNISAITYDGNGNIKTMRRNGANGFKSFGEVDSLNYLYMAVPLLGEASNKLVRVKDQLASNSHFTKDFKPNTASTQVYGYDANGNQISNSDKKISSIVYNHLNLPREINFEGSIGKILYDYDAEGNKLKQRIFTGAAVTDTTDYVGEYVFNNNILDYIMHEEGRIVMEGGVPVYEFYIKDHLGNVRQVIRPSQTQVFRATMETRAAEEEERMFSQVTETRQTAPEHNVTDGGNKVAWLNAARGRALGPSRTQEVFEGDSVRISVFGKYQNRRRRPNISSMAPAGAAEVIASDFGNIALAGGANPATILTIADLIARDLQGRKVPEAYLMYALYDSDSNLYAQGKKLLSKRSENQHEELTESLYISKSGYMETFVVNETNQDVWFDNFRIQSTTPVIVQETDYDPWGLEHFGTKFQAAGVKVNKYLYNGKELIEDNGLQYYDYGARMYDASIGRWSVVDPLAHLYPGISPYAYVANNPINAIDPDGRLIIFINGMHTGDGGKKRYWNGLDTRIMNRVGDHHARYYDGSMGGAWNTASRGILTGNNLIPGNRRRAGKSMGFNHAAEIFNSLGDGESIKIATHSMGAAYGKGFIQGLRKYAKKNNIDIADLIEFEVDLAPFQPTQQEAQEGVPTTVVAHEGDPVAGSSPMPGADNNVTRKGKKKSLSEHSVDSFDQREIDQFVPQSTRNRSGTSTTEQKPDKKND